MKPTAEKLASIPAIDGGFVVSVPIPAAMKAHFEAAYWREYLDGQIECWHACACVALRSLAPEWQAIGTGAAQKRWALDRKALSAFRWRRLAPLQLRFRLDPAIEWELVGNAIGVPAVKLLQAALATRYRQSLEFEAAQRAERQRGIDAGSIIPMFAASA